MSLDFPNDQWDLYINGKANMTYLYRQARKLNERFSDRKDLPMVIRLGHYYFDNKPILGTILDFHVWDRYLTTFSEPKSFVLKYFRLLSSEELSLYSDCTKSVSKSGNIINPNSEIKVYKNK